MAPEHPLLDQITTEEQKKAVKNYKEEAKHKSELDRQSEKEKTGIYTGSYAINPINDERLPIWIADYVLMGYGTGAIMSVPAHDERDFEFAQKYELPILRVVESEADAKKFKALEDENITEEEAGNLIEALFQRDSELEGLPFTEPGVCCGVNFSEEDLEILEDFEEDSEDTEGKILYPKNESYFKKQEEFMSWIGLSTEKTKEKVIQWVENNNCGKRRTTYRLRDWSISRQRYWGSPIPIIHCPDCGEVPVPEKDLPVELPTDVDFMPTGESPMRYSKTFHEVSCPKCGNAEAKRENDTMDTFVCSSWYFFAFAKAAELKQGENPMKKFKDKSWLPVDLYVGGAEHTVMHLLYSRFFTKAAHRAGLIDFDEPFLKLRHQGMIMAEDGRKMSKSLGNVINPDEIVDQYGADTLRMYEMFMGPFEQSITWSTTATEGIYKFLQKIWRIYNDKELIEIKDKCPIPEVRNLLHKTIKKVTEDIEELKFNTAISQMMIFMNALHKNDVLPIPMAEKFCKLLYPFAPHLAEEIWKEVLGHKNTISFESWPDYNPKYIVDENVTYAVQVNGKLRGDFTIRKEASKEEAIETAKKLEKVVKYLEEGEIKKEIFVPGKIVGFVVK